MLSLLFSFEYLQSFRQTNPIFFISVLVRTLLRARVVGPSREHRRRSNGRNSGPERKSCERRKPELKKYRNGTSGTWSTGKEC